MAWFKLGRPYWCSSGLDRTRYSQPRTTFPCSTSELEPTTPSFASSIVTPTYNHERFIGACIESVLAQSYTNWEMIIVDDGSTDNTWNILQYYTKIDARIRPFHQENKGIWCLAETYNFALQHSRGEM